MSIRPIPDANAITYLGDGVYARFTEGDLILTTSNGLSTTNTIILEPEVWSNLLMFMDVVKAKILERRALNNADKNSTT